MNYDQIKDRLAPCGLHCGKCFAFTEGDIRKYSSLLKESLGNFDIYARRFADLLHEPKFEKYQEFKILLDYFTTTECKGCRKEKCKLYADCKVRSCSEAKGVDFCFQCSHFPCHNTGFDEHLYKRFVKINLKMKEAGVEQYYNEVKDQSRY